MVFFGQLREFELAAWSTTLLALRDEEQQIQHQYGEDDDIYTWDGRGLIPGIVSRWYQSYFKVSGTRRLPIPAIGILKAKIIMI